MLKVDRTLLINFRFPETCGAQPVHQTQGDIMTIFGVSFMSIGLALLLFLPTFRNRHARFFSQIASASVFGAGTIGFVYAMITPPV